MKFALACDSSSVRSYYAKEGEVFTFDNVPYNRVHHIKNECLMGFWNYPVLFDGYYINLGEENYPFEDFDIIFAAIESNIGYLDVLKELYPKAKVVGTIKEALKSKEVRNKLIKQTDSFTIPYLTFDYFKEYGYNTPKNIHRIPQPVNIEYLQKHFNVNKQEHIFDYSNTWVGGRKGPNQQLLSRLGYQVKQGSHSNWHEFIDMWKGSKYMLNLDPTNNFGQQATQCAALGTVMLGGFNDAHKVLYPELALCNLDELAVKFDRLESDQDYYNQVLNYASSKLEELYSFNAVRNQIESIL
jgi:hypothetical protein